MGRPKPQPESCWHFCFHTSEIYCNLLRKERLLCHHRKSEASQEYWLKKIKNHSSWCAEGDLGLLGKIFKATICYLLLTVKQLVACCVPYRAFADLCLHQSCLWRPSSLLSCDLIAFLTHQNLFHVRRPCSLACSLHPNDSSQGHVRVL